MNAAHELAAQIAVRCVAQAGELADPAGAFVYDAPFASDVAGVAGVVLPREPPARARELLANGVARVYLGQAALADSQVVERLAVEFGNRRIGVYVPSVRMEVSWEMDGASNADFRFMRPSVCEPCWEVLDRSGRRTGIHAAWWVEQMFLLGASSALMLADIADEADLNICAGLVERFGERLWIGPLGATAPSVDSWLREGAARQLAVPAALYAEMAKAA